MDAAGDVLSAIRRVHAALGVQSAESSDKQKVIDESGQNGTQQETPVLSTDAKLEAILGALQPAAGDNVAIRLSELEQTSISKDAEIAKLKRENAALKAANQAQQAGLDAAAAVNGGPGAKQEWQRKLEQRHARDVRRLQSQVDGLRDKNRKTEERCRQLEQANNEQSELEGAQQEINSKIKTLYKESLLEKEALEQTATTAQAQLEVEQQRSKALQDQVASTLKLTNQLKEYIKNKEMECENLSARLRETTLKLEEEQVRASEEQSVVSSARSTLAVAEVELEVKASQIKELERAKEHEEQTRAELLQQLYDLQSRFESVQQHEQMSRQQLESANQARKALDERLKTTTQTLLARIEAFEALKDKFAESETTRRKLRKIARTQREKLETSHREIILFRHHQEWHEAHERVLMLKEERQQRLGEAAQKQSRPNTRGPRRAPSLSIGGPFANGRLDRKPTEQWELYDRHLPAPSCSLDSPEIQGLLHSWTHDPQKRNILNQWFRIIESGGAADPSFVRGVELSNLDLAVAKGILRVLVPVLRKSTTMPVSVHTKEVHIVKMDVRLSVDPSRVSF